MNAGQVEPQLGVRPHVASIDGVPHVAVTAEGLEGEDEVVIYRQGNRVILEGARREWREEFLALAGAARDFPYPDEPPAADTGPDFG